MHPYHPLSGQEFELLTWSQAWCEDRVFFEDREGKVRFLPASWTDVGPADPFVTLSGGRAIFRLEDLRALAALVGDLRESGKEDGDRVKEITPRVLR